MWARKHACIRHRWTACRVLGEQHVVCTTGHLCERWAEREKYIKPYSVISEWSLFNLRQGQRHNGTLSGSRIIAKLSYPVFDQAVQLWLRRSFSVSPRTIFVGIGNQRCKSLLIDKRKIDQFFRSLWNSAWQQVLDKRRTIRHCHVWIFGNGIPAARRLLFDPKSRNRKCLVLIQLWTINDWKRSKW